MRSEEEDLKREHENADEHGTHGSDPLRSRGASAVPTASTHASHAPSSPEPLPHTAPALLQ
jgi:hypothetical protein